MERLPIFGCLAILLLTSLLVDALEKMSVKITKVDIQNSPNPYLGDFSGTVYAPGDTFSLKTPAKADLPSTMRWNVNSTLNGQPLPEYDMLLCVAFEDPVFAQDIINNYYLPKGEFSNSCPIKAGNNFEISKYKLPIDNYPDIPAGEVVANIMLYETGKKPYVTAHIELEIGIQLPEFGLKL